MVRTPKCKSAHITTLDGWCCVQNTKTKRVKEQLLNHQTNKKVKKTSYAKKILDLKNKGVEEITGLLLKQQKSLSAKCTSEGKKNYFLNFNLKESEYLVSQQWVAKNMEEFHKSINTKYTSALYVLKHGQKTLFCQEIVTILFVIGVKKTRVPQSGFLSKII